MPCTSFGAKATFVATAFIAAVRTSSGFMATLPPVGDSDLEQQPVDVDADVARGRGERFGASAAGVDAVPLENRLRCGIPINEIVDRA
jgi:hypothetical protein